ncbi:MAG TPA: hypothetical protein VFZ76_12575 [Anaerolineales bacterium]
MLATKLKTAYNLSIIITILIMVASAGGLFIDGLYRDNTWTTTQLRGSDLVRLVVAVPVLVAALIFAKRGSQRAQLIWLGMLWLTVYDYAFFLFGAAFNVFFLVYVALFSLSILALIFALPRVDAKAISRKFKARTPVKWISAYMLFIAIFLGGLWTAQTLNFIVTGQLPQSNIDSGHPTNIVFALDLALLVPGLVLAAVWLWKRRPWGYVLGAMMLVKGTIYPMALIGMAIFYYDATRIWDPLAWFWIVFTAVSLMASAFFFGNIGSSREQVDSRVQGEPVGT